MVHTICELINKIEKYEVKQAKAVFKTKTAREMTGASDVLKLWYKDLVAADNTADLDAHYYSLYGFISGLHATHYINAKEKRLLFDQLSMLCDQRSSVIGNVCESF